MTAVPNAVASAPRRSRPQPSPEREALPDLGPLECAPDAEISQLAYAVLRTQLLTALAHAPGTRAGRDPEELHKMRVAVRRMRAAYKLFSAHLPDAIIGFRKELKWLGSKLGAVRDIDVHLEQLAEPDDPRDPLRSTLEWLRVDLLRQRRVERRQLLAALRSARYRRLVDGLSESLRRGPIEYEKRAHMAIREIAPALVERRYRAFRRKSRALTAASSAEDFHRARIQCKALRYAVEFHRPYLGRAADRFIKRLRRVQNHMGLQQDAVVAQELFHRLATERDELSRETVFALGSLAERRRLEEQRLKRECPRVHARLKRREWKQLRAALAAQAPPATAIAPATESGEAS